jgi:hypothetical protein
VPSRERSRKQPGPPARKRKNGLVTQIEELRRLAIWSTQFVLVVDDLNDDAIVVVIRVQCLKA